MRPPANDLDFNPTAGASTRRDGLTVGRRVEGARQRVPWLVSMRSIWQFHDPERDW